MFKEFDINKCNCMHLYLELMGFMLNLIEYLKYACLKNYDICM